MSLDARFGLERGAFAPMPGAGTAPTVLRALTRLELKLFLRNGEQLMLNMLIPLAVLIGLCVTPFGHLASPRAGTVVPGVIALAVVSSAFTGQAIAVGFDRRYGALKRLGATIAPPWAIIVGKLSAVTGVVALQTLLIGVVGFCLGWQPSVLGLATMVVVIVIGAAAVAATGLLLGGSLRAEIVLPLANILWFVQTGLCGLALVSSPSKPWIAVIDITPMGALATGLRAAADSRIDIPAIAVLAVWGVVATALARRTFKFV
ncbi:ABC transporter permease [Nocardia sp. CA2R105]|uniref:ABC transporter permease n=1 Tax=Nocardia coffeae TaxID=2873381 RepID=UPI001CA6D807|nr:ABC transporter permease [Nocardia coffeae]MBY8861995.1 ABC transporter permease [Nocardia coffeae]